MTGIRQSFEATFSKDLADQIVRAAESHENGVHDKRGSDPFKWALLICIGHQCLEKEDYRAYHEIECDWPTVKQWIKDHADLGTHDGDCDYLAAFSGAYNEYISEAEA